MAGSHSLQRLMNEIARDVSDPVKGTSAAERLRGRALLGSDEDDRRRALAREEIRLDALGSGSDYTPFLQHLGIASLNVGFGGEGDYGQYHSIYDSFDHYVRFMDPDFAYGAALAKVGGRARAAPGAGGAAAVRVHGGRRGRGVATSRRSRRSPAACAARPSGTTRRSSAGPSRRWRRPTRRASRRRARTRCRT